MPIGPGKYDDLATYVREQAQARAVIVLVFDGNKGSGFSVQSYPEVSIHLPDILRTMAEEIEQQTPQV